MNKKLIIGLIIVLGTIILILIKFNTSTNIYQLEIEDMIDEDKYTIVEEYIKKLYENKKVKYNIRAMSEQQEKFIINIMEYDVEKKKNTTKYILLDKFNNPIYEYNISDYNNILEELEEKIELDAIKNEKRMNIKQVTIILNNGKNPELIDSISF